LNLEQGKQVWNCDDTQMLVDWVSQLHEDGVAAETAIADPACEIGVSEI
jgi:hypothetical protein